jgi:hypothetical protein
LAATDLSRAERTINFGIAYGFDGVSLRFRRQLDPLINLRSEQIVEAFYALALTPFIVLTGDLQLIQPTLRRSDLAVVPGVRMVIHF